MPISQGQVSMMNVVAELLQGRMVPARFQRAYVWEAQDVLKLCRSLELKIPLGAIVSWIAPDDASQDQGRHRLGPVHLAHGQQHAKLLVDGQNRMASIAWMLRDPAAPVPEDLSEKERATWASGRHLVMNLATRKFEFLERDEGLTMPIRALFDTRLVSRFQRERWNRQWSDFDDDEKDAGLDWVGRCCNATSHAQMIETVLHDCSRQEAVEAFIHMSKLGVPMSEEDFRTALGLSDATAEPPAHGMRGLRP